MGEDPWGRLPVESGVVTVGEVETPAGFGVLVTADRRIIACCNGLMLAPVLLLLGTLLLLTALELEFMPPFAVDKFI